PGILQRNRPAWRSRICNTLGHLGGRAPPNWRLKLTGIPQLKHGPLGGNTSSPVWRPDAPSFAVPLFDYERNALPRCRRPALSGMVTPNRHLVDTARHAR